MADFTAPIAAVGGGGGGSMQGLGPDYGTLDEPVADTIMRDLRMVGNKMMCVLNPRKANIQTLKDWDLWGPLILCLMLATLLSWFAPYEQKSLVFASVFVIIWCGAAVVTVNALLLGGNISFFQVRASSCRGTARQPCREPPACPSRPPPRPSCCATRCATSSERALTSSSCSCHAAGHVRSRCACWGTAYSR